ncbi:MAG: hypothetical protein H6739_08410 [Alphaproteobacteria bacterium]|nr:hypothetical protein [Alphaproteobacteria bacterium]
MLSISSSEAKLLPPLEAPDVVELLIRRRDEADAACADVEQATALLPRLVAVSTVALGAYAVVHGGMLSLAEDPLFLDALTARGPLPTIGVVFLAYVAGLFGAQVASLPSAYFYALLTGIRTHGWRVAVEAMRAQATSAVVLLGLLPVYLAVGLGFSLSSGGVGEGFRILAIDLLGYTLPFVAGLAGVITMGRAFSALVREARPEPGRRAMPLLLVFAWSVLFTALAPLGVWRVLSVLGG